jgi:PAS domain S-box-containing protein
MIENITQTIALLIERKQAETERERLLIREKTAREQAEEANAQLRESEERFRLTIDEAPIGMALVSLDGRFLRVNRVLCEITGYSADEMTRLKYQDITHPDDLERETTLAGRLTRGELSRAVFEKRDFRKDGSMVDVKISASLLRSPDGTPWYYISQIEDITEVKRAEEALHRAVAAREQVLGIVAHDLRNPLSNIIIACAALDRGGLESAQTKELISRGARRMNGLIEDLLDVSLVEAGQLKLEKRRLSPKDLISEAVEMQAPLAFSSAVQIRLAAADGLNDVIGDHDRLVRVLDNLLGNAMKFTPPGGHITVGATPGDHEIVFSVADTGCGIAPDNLIHVFERFWKVTTTANRRGAGLGLPITKGIIDAHGGRIWAESQIGKGSSFFFTLPLAA